MTRLWQSLESGDKRDLRCLLMDHLLLNHSSLPTFLSNKLMKIIVLIGRVAWPHEYPEFFDQMMQVCVCVCVRACVGVCVCVCVCECVCVCMRVLSKWYTGIASCLSCFLVQWSPWLHPFTLSCA